MMQHANVVYLLEFKGLYIMFQISSGVVWQSRDLTPHVISVESSILLLYSIKT